MAGAIGRPQIMQSCERTCFCGSPQEHVALA